MIRLATLFLLLSFSLTSCWFDRESDCTAADYATDILGGPTTSFGESCYAYLSNEYDGRKDEQEITRYPVFLNWEAGCSEKYTVNTICKRHTISFGSGEVITFYKGHSIFDLPSRQSLASTTLLPAFGLDYTFQVDQMLSINNVPLFDSIVFLPGFPFPYQYDQASERLVIELPANSLANTLHHCSIAVRLDGEDYFRAVTVDLFAVPLELSFDELTERLRWRTIEFGDIGALRAQIDRVIDPEREFRQKVFAGPVRDNQIRLLVPDDPASYIGYFSGNRSGDRFIAWNGVVA